MVEYNNTKTIILVELSNHYDSETHNNFMVEHSEYHTKASISMGFNSIFLVESTKHNSKTIVFVELSNTITTNFILVYNNHTKTDDNFLVEYAKHNNENTFILVELPDADTTNNCKTLVSFSLILMLNFIIKIQIVIIFIPYGIFFKFY